mgnify:CR=1 FL=1
MTLTSLPSNQALLEHYEIFKDGERINPINFYYGSLTAEEFNAMLKAAELEGQSYD